MTTKERYVALALILAVVLGMAYILHRSDVERAQDMATMQATLKQQNEIISQLGKQMEARSAQAEADKKTLQAQADSAKTLQQQLALIASRMSLPQPINVTLPATEHPDAPSAVSVPTANVSTLLDYTTTCEQCKVDRAALSENLRDSQSQLGSMTKERDAAVSAAKGGSKWTRFKRAAKWLAIGGAIGAVGMVAR